VAPRGPIIALFGPTAVGKTDIALALARRLRRRGEHPVAVSADALQVYRGLELLTGVADPAQQAELEHRLVSFVPLNATFSVGQYSELAHAVIDELMEQGATPIVVGGTGLYLRAALVDLDLRPAPPADVRERWMGEVRRRGASALHAELRRRAPLTAAAIHPNDHHRIVRALELEELGLLPAHGRTQQLWTQETRHPTRLIGLVMEREALYARIDSRVQAMVAAGAAEQVRFAHAAGASETARQALGFQELLVDDIERMKRRTRNYARRQLTWMRKLPGVELIDVTGRAPDDIATALDMIDAR
jgi:tRNA dimethylallyltransferase